MSLLETLVGFPDAMAILMSRKQWLANLWHKSAILLEGLAQTSIQQYCALQSLLAILM